MPLDKLVSMLIVPEGSTSDDLELMQEQEHEASDSPTTTHNCYLVKKEESEATRRIVFATNVA